MIAFKLPVTFNSVTLCITLLLLMMNFGFGQEDCRFIFNSNESYLNIQEGVIKNELSIFIKKASNSQKNSINIRLNNVKLKKCSDSFVFFEKGNIYESELIISIESKNNGKSILVREVFFSHYKFGFSLPDSVINDHCRPKVLLKLFIKELSCCISAIYVKQSCLSREFISVKQCFIGWFFYPIYFTIYATKVFK